VNGEVSTVFGDSAWTVAHPLLRDELMKRVGALCAKTGAPASERSDVVQDALNAAVRHRSLLRRLSAPQRSSWFWVVLTRLARRRAQSKAGSSFSSIEVVCEIPDTRIEDPASALERRERVALVRDALGALPDPWQRVLWLRNLHSDNWDAVASCLQSTPGAARALWYRALAALRERLVAHESFADGTI